MPAALPLGLRRRCYRVAYRLATVWWWVRRPDAFGVKLLILDGDRAVFVRHTYGPDVWEVPGGGRKRGETPLQAARREVREELGLPIDRWEDVGLIVDRQKATANLTCLVAAYDGSPLVPAEAELAEVRWVSVHTPPEPLGRHARGFLALPGLVLPPRA